MEVKLVKSLALLFLGSVFISMPFANINADEWMKTYGEGIGKCVQQTSDGGYIITGYGYRTYVGVCLIKTDSLGDTLWTKIFKDTEGIGYYVRQTSDGGYIVAGQIRCHAPWADREGYLIKTDSIGNLQWRKFYDFTNGLSCVDQTSDGGYIATGGIRGLGTWVLRTDSLGDTLRSRALEDYPSGSGNWIAQLSSNCYAVIGYYYAGSENWPVYFIKMDSLGNVFWEVEYDTLTYIHDSWPGSVDMTSDGGYIIMGDRGIVKVDSVGNVVWQRNGTYPPKCIEQTFDGGYVCLRGRRFMKLDSLGDSLWTKELTLPVESHGYYIQQTSDSGYIVTGDKWEGGGVWKVVLIKTYNPVGVEETEDCLTFKIVRITPNPVVSSVFIDYYIGSPSNIELGIYDVSGKLVKVLEKEKRAPGFYQVLWNTNNVPGGIYFCILKQGIAVSSEKVIVVK